jgi:hypothetical protein
MTNEPENPNSLKSKTQQAIAEATAALIAQLEKGNSEALTNYLTAMSRFRKYSFGNVMMIARQAPHASHVAGFKAWKEHNRFVKKGEKGIAILAPIIVTKDRKGEKLEKGPRMVGCRAVYVFDISQTDGEPLPNLSMDVTGDPGAATARLMEFCAARSIQIEMVDDLGGALGISEGGKIKLVKDDAAPARFFSTFVHEVAHELLHRTERRKQTTKTVRETEAEATAFIVCQSIGLNPANSSADYIRMYNGDAATLAESLKFVSEAARDILAAIEPEAEEAAEELAA